MWGRNSTRNRKQHRQTLANIKSKITSEALRFKKLSKILMSLSIMSRFSLTAFKLLSLFDFQKLNYEIANVDFFTSSYLEFTELLEYKVQYCHWIWEDYAIASQMFFLSVSLFPCLLGLPLRRSLSLAHSASLFFFVHQTG